MHYRFTNEDLKDLYVSRGRGVLAKRFPVEVVRAFLRKVDLIADVESETDLFALRGNDFKPADWYLSGSHSLRLNDQFRLIVFREEKNRMRILALHEIVDYH